MTILTHFVAGAAICRVVKWQPAGLALALVSHLALDALPHFEHAGLMPPEQREWGRWVPRVVSLLAIPLLWVVWRRAGRRLGPYLLAGGLLACLLDGLTKVFSHHSLPGWLNEMPHLVWAGEYRRVVAAYGVWSPLAAPLCIAVELIVLAVTGWLLFRRAPAADGIPTEGD